MFNLINIEIGSFGPSVTALGFVGRGSEELPQDKAGRLSVPWQDVQESPSVFALLNWRAAISNFEGREDEMKALRAWAGSNPTMSVKFITGEGGVGKSRLAAEFAGALQTEKWAAGFVDLRKPQSFRHMKAGSLLVIDYPEEDREGVLEFFRDLASLGNAGRFRVLFLTRRNIDEWYDVVVDSGAAALLDHTPIPLGRLDETPAYDVYHSALERAAEAYGTTPQPVSEEALHDWLQQAPENDRALFLVAAGMHSALHPDDPVVQYTGREVIESLVEREISRLRRAARQAGLKDEYVFARLVAMAAVAGSLPLERLRNMELPGFPPNVDLATEAERAGLVTAGAVPAPGTDIPAAALVNSVLAKRPDIAPEVIWTAIKDDLKNGLERCSRLSWDAEVVLGIHDHRIGLWLGEVAASDQVRANSLAASIFADIPLYGIVDAEIASLKKLLDSATTDQQKALVLDRLAICLSEVGDRKDAVFAVNAAVEIYRTLAEANPLRYEADLAGSLSNQSRCKGEVGDSDAALSSIDEAIEIYRRLLPSNPTAYEYALAGSLVNQSHRRIDVGDAKRALGSINEAVEIYSRLVSGSPLQYQAELATALNNQSNLKTETGDISGALYSSMTATDIWRQLASNSPSRYEAELARSLHTESNARRDVGDVRGALVAIKEATGFYRRMAAANPARYEPDLGMSLINLSTYAGNDGDSETAGAAIDQAVSIYQRLAKENPARYESELALSLNNRAVRRIDIGDMEGAISSAHEAIEIYRRLAKSSPARYEPELARVWGTKGSIFFRTGQIDEAIKCLERGASLLRPYAEQLPSGPSAQTYNRLERDISNLNFLRQSQEILEKDPENAGAWKTKGSALFNLRRYDEALGAFERALASVRDDAVIWSLKGLACGNLNRPQDAIAAFEEALSRDSGNAVSWHYKGLALANIGRHEDAILAYERAIHIDPVNTNARVQMIKSLLNVGLTKRALEHVPALLRDSQYLRSFLHGIVSLFVVIAADEPEGLFEIIANSPNDDLLVPFITALKIDLGPPVRIAREIEPVAKGILEGIRTVRSG